MQISIQPILWQQHSTYNHINRSRASVTIYIKHQNGEKIVIPVTLTMACLLVPVGLV